MKNFYSILVVILLSFALISQCIFSDKLTIFVLWLSIIILNFEKLNNN